MRRKDCPSPVMGCGVMIVTLLLVGCRTETPSATATPEETFQLVVEDGLEGVVFTAESAEQMRLDALISDDIDGYWTPSREDVRAFEQGLTLYLSHAAPLTYPGPLRELSAYRRQYFGLLVNEQRVIYVIFFCAATHVDWQREIVAVLDGGSCYFELKYDVQIDSYYDLSIHGEA